MAETKTYTPEEYVTPAELCARWGIDRRTLGKLFGAKLPVLKVTARVWRIARADVEAYEAIERISPHRAT